METRTLPLSLSLGLFLLETLHRDRKRKPLLLAAGQECTSSSSASKIDWSLLFQCLPLPVICSELTTSRKPSVFLKPRWATARTQGKVDAPHLPALSSEEWFPECAQHSGGIPQDQWLSEKAGPRAMDQVWSHLCAQSRKYTKSYRGTGKKKTKGYSANANSVT